VAISGSLSWFTLVVRRNEPVLEPEKRQSFYLGPLLVSCLSAAPYNLYFKKFQQFNNQIKKQIFSS